MNELYIDLNDFPIGIVFTEPLPTGISGIVDTIIDRVTTGTSRIKNILL